MTGHAFVEKTQVRAEPLKWDDDKEFGAKFGGTKYPVLLFLDWKAEKVAAALR